jgi:hypothetical protein
MRLRLLFAASLAIAGACTSFSTSSSRPETPDAAAAPPSPDADVSGDATVADAGPTSPCAVPHVFCADFESASFVENAGPFQIEFGDDAGMTLVADHGAWKSPSTSLLATAEPLDAGRTRDLERKFDTAQAAIDLRFALQLVKTSSNPTDSDVIVALLSVGAPSYVFTIRIRGQHLLLGEVPPADEGGTSPTTLHTLEMADLTGETDFVDVHLGVDTTVPNVTLDVGSKPILVTKLAGPIFPTNFLRLDVGVTATPPFSSTVSYRIDDVTIDTR